jgi:hypothetical protein
MEVLKRRNRQFVRMAFVVALAGIVLSCGKPPVAHRVPEAALAPVEAPEAEDSPQLEPVSEIAPKLAPKVDLIAPAAKPKRPSKSTLGLPDPDTGTYLTPQARINKRRGKRMWSPEWDEFIKNALPAKMLSGSVPRDVRDACPRFFELSDSEKKTFWAYFFQSIAVPESGFNYADRYREKGIPGVDPVSGKPNVSEGLLQLSYQDAKYHGCDFDWKADQALKGTGEIASIHDPKRNLECGVKILYKQLFSIYAPRTLFTSSRFYYWSVLVRGSAGYSRVMKQLEGVPSFCKHD